MKPRSRLPTVVFCLDKYRMTALILRDFFSFLFYSLLPFFFIRSAATARKKERRMGRAKLEIRLREDFRARCTTYMTRMKGLRKKADELHLLCGVDVLVASSSPKLNTVEFWPAKDTPEFHRIRERYLYFRKKQSGDEENGNASIPSASVPPLFYKEMASMEIKLKEVRERLLFLNAPSNKEELECQAQEEERLQSHFMISIPSQLDFYSQQDLLADFCTPLQQDLLTY